MDGQTDRRIRRVTALYKQSKDRDNIVKFITTLRVEEDYTKIYYTNTTMTMNLNNMTGYAARKYGTLIGQKVCPISIENSD